VTLTATAFGRPPTTGSQTPGRRPSPTSVWSEKLTQRHGFARQSDVKQGKQSHGESSRVTQHKDEPIVKQRGAVVILDALGMKGIWQRGSAKRVVHRMYHVSDITKKHIDEPRIIHHDIEGLTPHELSRAHSRIQFNVQTISDTVIITAYSQLRPGQLLRHLAADLYGIYRVALSHGVVYRGAVSFGDFYRQGGALVGPAVDEAAEWHTLPDCAGVVLSPTAGAIVDRYTRARGAKEPFGFVRLPVPLKGGSKAECWTLDWYRCWLPLTKLEESFLRSPVSPEVAVKLENTLTLCRSMWNLCKDRNHGVPLPWRDVSDAQFNRIMGKSIRDLKVETKRLKAEGVTLRRRFMALARGNPRARFILTKYLAEPRPASPEERETRLRHLREQLANVGVTFPAQPVFNLETASPERRLS
jgi:hypothetical protein